MVGNCFMQTSSASETGFLHAGVTMVCQGTDFGPPLPSDTHAQHIEQRPDVETRLLISRITGPDMSISGRYCAKCCLFASLS